ncbi:hypothetical protein [Ekhidna sp.]|uniref:hypothetical protein n=1 Tax=Ekhidna sp. TaxID=2608089 RepID=UPI0032993A11
MKRFLIISFLIGAAVYTAEAQLLEDNDSRLKTKKVERKGFLFFRSKKKPGNSAGIPSSGRRTPPRYSSASSPFRLSTTTSPRYSSVRDRQKRYSVRPRTSGGVISFKTRKYSPRYSGGNPFRGSDYKVTPRYSYGNPFRGSKFKASPRYSGGNPFRGKDYKVSIRYSRGNPFKGRSYKVSPRYSPSNPFRGRDYKVNIRYSQGSPFRAKDYRITPRYSRGMPFRSKDYRITPRYSQGMPFRSKDYKITPRYSQGMPFRGKDFHVRPRYSAGSPFRGVDFKVRPRYSGTKIRFFGNSREWGESKYFQESSLWEGDMKVKNRRIGDQHPSSNYHMAMKFSNPKIRKMFRKWNIFWTRMNGNKQNSNGVNEPVKEPKFDKKERVIWNN